MKKKISNNAHRIVAKPYTSGKIHLSKEDLRSGFYRIDVVAKGVDHAVPSYEGRIFINNTSATYDTPTDLKHGYVGSYSVFGHGSCLGDEGHCEVHTSKMMYDEIPDPLTRSDYSITVTEKMKTIAKNTNDFYVTIVPIPCLPPDLGGEKPDLENVVKLQSLSIEIYDKEMEV